VSNQTQTSSNTNNINLLDEIFSATSFKPGQQKTTSVTQNNNILDFSNLNNQNQTKQQASQGNLFDMLGNNPNTNNNAALKKTDFSPIKIDTDAFGEYWTNCSHDEKSFDLVSKYINSPEKFFEVIKNNGNFFPVEIIEDQAIVAAKLKNKLVLVHSTISGYNVNVLLKCYESSQYDIVANFLKEII